MPVKQAVEEFVTEATVAELTGLTPRTLALHRRSGIGPPHFRFGRKNVRYRLSEVEKWAAGHHVSERSA